MVAQATFNAFPGLDCQHVLPLQCTDEMMGAHLPTVPLSPFITFTRTVTVNFRPRRAVYGNVIVSLGDVVQGKLDTRGRVEQHDALKWGRQGGLNTINNKPSSWCGE